MDFRCSHWPSPASSTSAQLPLPACPAQHFDTSSLLFFQVAADKAWASKLHVALKSNAAKGKLIRVKSSFKLSEELKVGMRVGAGTGSGVHAVMCSNTPRKTAPTNTDGLCSHTPDCGDSPPLGERDLCLRRRRRGGPRWQGCGRPCPPPSFAVPFLRPAPHNALPLSMCGHVLQKPAKKAAKKAAPKPKKEAKVCGVDYC